jgi:hypothetical protein
MSGRCLRCESQCLGDVYQNGKYAMCMPCAGIALQWYYKSPNFTIPDIDEVLEIGVLYSQHIRGVPPDLATLESKCKKCYNQAIWFREKQTYLLKMDHPDKPGHKCELYLDRTHKTVWLTIRYDGRIISNIKMSELSFYSCCAHGHNFPEIGTLDAGRWYENTHGDSDHYSILSYLSKHVGDLHTPPIIK